MAKPTTRLSDIRVTIRRNNAKFGTVAVERQYIWWQQPHSKKWISKSWNEFHKWMTS